MPSVPPEELLPVLVADLADAEARDVLDAAAFTGGKVWVPLETAPVSASQHVLEVHVPGLAEALLYMAQPAGPPTPDGFPLRIKHMPDARPSRPSTTPRSGNVVKGRRATTNVELTPSHHAELTNTGKHRKAEVPDFVGRALAGGKLVIEQLIGSGGVGAVYKARHRELRMPVAVKVLHESFQHDIDFCQRFYAEALAASKLDHVNITRVLDFGQEPDGQLYFAMEFLDGTELRFVLEEERVLPAPRIADIMMQVCAGLSHAHARGIIHRDIKPENLVLVSAQDDDGNPIEIVKVCDFGIAQQAASPMQQAEGTVAGTPEYMSPEQCRGDELDQRSDIYACGVILYELATGQVPFTAERPQSILNKQQFTPALPPSKINPKIDPKLEAIAMKALAKEVEDRYQTMRELRADLRELLASFSEDSPPPASVREKSIDSFKPASIANAMEASSRHVTPAESTEPEWLERGFSHSGPSSGTQRIAPAADAPLEIAPTNLKATVHRLAQTMDPAAFARGLRELEPILRDLASRGDVRGLWDVAATLNNVAIQGTRAPGSRAEIAVGALRVFEDPTILTHVALLLLAGTEDQRDYAKRLLTQAGVAGAYGLYGARVKLAAQQSVRGPFVTVLKDFGPKAWPVVRAALEKILDSELNSSTLDLAEDLLLCVPLVGDESAGHIVVKYLRVNSSGVCRAATASIVKLWGDRAKPLLVGMIQSKDDVVRVAGLAGLRQLNSIDEHIVPRLHAILTRRVDAGEELRAAAAVALAHAAPTAKPAAVSLLAELITPTRTQVARPQGPAGTLTREDAVVIAIARSLLHVGGKGYRGLVAERAERSAEPLRAQLKGLLAAG